MANDTYVPYQEQIEKSAAQIINAVEVDRKRRAMSVRVKVNCNFKQSNADGSVMLLQFSPVYSGSEENKRFFAATPGGTFAFYTVNKSAADEFEQGKEYYMDITSATE